MDKETPIKKVIERVKSKLAYLEDLAKREENKGKDVAILEEGIKGIEIILKQLEDIYKRDTEKVATLKKDFMNGFKFRRLP